MEFVSWDDYIPNIWKNKIHVPNHQPDYIWWCNGKMKRFPCFYSDLHLFGSSRTRTLPGHLFSHGSAHALIINLRKQIYSPGETRTPIEQYFYFLVKNGIPRSWIYDHPQLILGSTSPYIIWSVVSTLLKNIWVRQLGFSEIHNFHGKSYNPFMFQTNHQAVISYYIPSGKLT